MGESQTQTNQSEERIVFFRKPTSIDELLDLKPQYQHQPVKVMKIIELTNQQFSYFAGHLLEDMPFIAANTALTGYDSAAKQTHCLLITTEGRANGIAVDSEGYDYARYAAFIPNKLRLNLEGVPVEHHSQPSREKRLAHER